MRGWAHPAKHGFGWTLLYRAALAFRQGNYAAAIVAYHECEQIIQQGGDANYRGLALRGLGNAHLRLGEIDAARRLFQESLQLNLALNSWRGIVACLTGIAATLAAKGNGRLAARLVGATETLLLNVTTALPLTDLVQWEHTQQIIHTLLDEATWQAARAEGRTLTLPQIVAIALAAGQPGADGQPATPVSPSAHKPDNSLSPRERQVAALLTQGKTNREIAEELVVGVKSVETYVTRILNKLGLATRLQIALWAVDQGLSASQSTPPNRAAPLVRESLTPHFSIL